MPRKARIDAPGALHHVIVRGIERRKIFRSDYDRENFLNRLAKLIPEPHTDCFAWAHIPNHVHLLLRTGGDVTASNKSPGTVKARALLCYWAHRKLGMTTVQIAGKLNLCQSAVSRLSMKGEKIGKEYGTLLLENRSKKS